MAKAAAKAAKADAASLLLELPKWWKLTRLWFEGPERWRARGYAAAVVGLAVVVTGLYVKISYAQKNFSTALSAKDQAGFYRSINDFLVIICVAAPLFSFTFFVEEQMVRAWRAYLTRVFTAAYFTDHAYFKIMQPEENVVDVGLAGQQAGSLTSLDNPDQRICEDVAAYVKSSTAIILALVKKILSCAAFAGVLWSVSQPLVVFMFAYALVGTLMTTSVFGPILMKLFYQMLSREADLRFSLVRVREAAESIAFYGGDTAEARVVDERLQHLLYVYSRHINWSSIYKLWTCVYNYATILLPPIFTAPRYFRGEIDFGTISQASYAFSSIEAALSIIVNNLTQITGLAAQTERLDRLLTALQQQQQTGSDVSDLVHLGRPPWTDDHRLGRASSRRHPDDAPCLSAISRSLGGEVAGMELSALTVALPSGSRLICQDLTIQLLPGQSLLVVGPSGCGKSSLLRALAGLWQCGRGHVAMNSKVMFLPQKPFMPIGSLRHQLLFPSTPVGRDGTGSDSRSISPAPSHVPSADIQLSKRQHVSMTGAATTARRRLSDTGDEDAPLLSHSDLTPASSVTPHHSSPHHSAVSFIEKPRMSGQTRFAHQLHAGSAGPSTMRSASAAALLSPERPGVNPGAASDADLMLRLEEVKLGNLMSRVGSLDAECDWSHMLSAGEQQRIAILRLLLHAPHLAFLDEATSALDQQTESCMYELMQQRCRCFVSVGHRLQLLRYHTHVLSCKQAPGASVPSWTMCTTEEYQAKLTATQGMGL